MREPKEILINGKTLEKILEDHKHWLNRDIDGWKNMYADLRYAHLSGADLKGVNLNSANLRYAHLRGANLSGANLNSANLNSANLRYAYLSGADLSDADLRGADLDKEEQIRKGVKLSNSITGWKKCKDGVMCNDKRIYFAR